MTVEGAARGPQMKKFFPDYLCAAGAQYLAEKIKTFWHEGGHRNVATWIVTSRNLAAEDNPNDKPVATWGVRSNLINGLPPKPQ
jgi:hypothetical protein